MDSGNGKLPMARCGSCICYVKDEMGPRGLLNVSKSEQGVCHRHPPQIVSVTAKTLEGVGLVPGAMFPQVGAEWWCAEFRAKPAAPPAVNDTKPA